MKQNTVNALERNGIFNLEDILSRSVYSFLSMERVGTDVVQDVATTVKYMIYHNQLSPNGKDER